MKILFLIVYFAASLFSTEGLAHPGGHGEEEVGPQLVAICNGTGGCAKGEVREAAKKYFSYLNNSYRLPVEWKEVSDPIWVKEMKSDKDIVWVSGFENPKPAESRHKNLFIVISKEGYLLGVTDNIAQLGELKNSNLIIGIISTSLVIILGFFVIKKFEA